MEAEVIQGMPEDEYRARPEDSQSLFKAHREATDAHAFFNLTNPKKPSEDMINGTCLHSLILEEKKIYAIAPECDRRTKEGKAAWAAFLAESEGLIPRNAENGAKIEGMVAGIRRNKEAMGLLESEGQTELSIFFQGMKARIDKQTPLGPCDIKSTGDGADDLNFSKSVLRWGYDIQAAHYLDMCAAAGLPCEKFWFIPVENYPPFEANVFYLGERSLLRGKKRLEELKERYYACKKSGIYAGFLNSGEINIPEWDLRKEGF